MNLGTLMLILTANTSGLTPAIRDLRKLETAVTTSTAVMNKQLNTVSQSMNVMGRTMTQYITLPLSLLGIAVTKTFSDFEYSIAKINGLVGVAKVQAQEWGEQILGLSSAVGKGPNELADALYFITSSGFTTSESMQILTVSAKAAAAGLSDTKAIADVVTSAMNAYGKGMLNASYATDVLVATVREGKGEAPELVRAFGQVIPIAAKLGVNFEQVGGAIAAMTRSGASAANASTYLRQMLFTLLKPTKDSEEALKEMGLTSQKLRDSLRNKGLLETLILLEEKTKGFGDSMIKSVFPNVRAYLGEANLMGANLKENIALFDRVKKSTDYTSIAYAAVADTIKFKLNQALSEGKVLMIRIGEALARNLLPFLEGLISIIKDTQHWFKNLNPSIQDSILKFTALAASLGPILLIFNLLKTAFISPIIVLFGTLVGVVKNVAAVFKIVSAEAKIATAAMSLMNVGTSAVKAVVALLTGNLQLARIAFNSMTTSLLACPYAWIAAAIIAIGAALFYAYKKSKELSEAEKVRIQVQERVIDSISEEKFQLERLLKVAESEYSSKKQKEIAIQELNRLMPIYNGWIDEEAVATGRAAEMVKNYIQILKKKYSMQAMEEVAVEEEKKYWKLVESGQNKSLSFIEAMKAIIDPNVVGDAVSNAVLGPLSIIKKIAEASTNIQEAENAKSEDLAKKHNEKMKTLYEDMAKAQGIQQKYQIPSFTPSILPKTISGPLVQPILPSSPLIVKSKVTSPVIPKIETPIVTPQVDLDALKELNEKIKKVFDDYNEQMRSSLQLKELIGDTKGITIDSKINYDVYDEIEQRIDAIYNTFQELSKLPSDTFNKLVNREDVQQMKSYYSQFAKTVEISKLFEKSAKDAEDANEKMFATQIQGMKDWKDGLTIVIDENVKLSKELDEIGKYAIYAGSAFDKLGAELDVYTVHLTLLQKQLREKIKAGDLGEIPLILSEIQKTENNINTVKINDFFKSFVTGFDQVNEKSKIFGGSFDKVGEEIEIYKNILNKAQGINLDSLFKLDPMMYTQFVTMVSGAVAKVKELEAVKQTNELIQSSLEDIFSVFAERLGQGKMKDFFSDLLGIILDFAKQFGRILISLGLAKIALERLGISGVGAVIAGMALIAAASAVGSLLAKGAKTDKVKMKEGGLVPSGYPNDTYPAMLTSGELVVPKNRVEEIMAVVSTTSNRIGKLNETAKTNTSISQSISKPIAFDKLVDINKRRLEVENVINENNKNIQFKSSKTYNDLTSNNKKINNTINKMPAFSQGGIVPTGYPNDSYPAMLTSGEIVTPPIKLPELTNQNIEVTVKIEGVAKGQDIYYVIKEVERRYKNTY